MKVKIEILENLSRANPFITSCHLSGAIIFVSKAAEIFLHYINSETAYILHFKSCITTKKFFPSHLGFSRKKKYLHAAVSGTNNCLKKIAWATLSPSSEFNMSSECCIKIWEIIRFWKIYWYWKNNSCNFSSKYCQQWAISSENLLEIHVVCNSSIENVFHYHLFLRGQSCFVCVSLHFWICFHWE